MTREQRDGEMRLTCKEAPEDGSVHLSGRELTGGSDQAPEDGCDPEGLGGRAPEVACTTEQKRVNTRFVEGGANKPGLD